MSELTIHFTTRPNPNDGADQPPLLFVSLGFPARGLYTAPVPYEPPLDDQALNEIRWYLELFATWPSGPDYEKAEETKQKLESWGRDLWRSVIWHDTDQDLDGAGLWQQFADDAASPKQVTIDATDPRILRLPWELLADRRGHLFARRISIRRRLQQATSIPVRSFELPVRLLVLVSRPDGAGFIDPRAVSLPLLDALEPLAEQVVVEFLYPPTLTALSDRLSDATMPEVHVVHFDGHGYYDQYQGLGYLLFEDEKHKEDMVDAQRLGTLLYECGVPLMVLNACQSAAQKEMNPYASVATSLLQAGVGSVLAMNYSVLVVAARKFVSAFYGGLARGLTVGQAVDRGRRALLADENRHTITRHNKDDVLIEETIQLRDWFLPALYQQALDPVIFPRGDRAAARPATAARPAPSPAANPQTALPGALPAVPQYGFHGRSKEMLALERALAAAPMVVLHGFGGLGKTALAAEAGRWFTRTGRFPGGAAFVSVEQGGSLAQICSWVGQAVSGDPDWVIHGDGDLVARVGQLLAEKPALVILDNFESLLGCDALMPAEELAELLAAVYHWTNTPAPSPPLTPASPRPRLLITTRDTTFPDGRFAPGQGCRHIQLGGLATDDALALAAAVLDAHSIDRATIPRQELVDLMAHLGGHPLSLNLVLPHLKEYTPAELTARFEELLPGFVTGQAQERNESLAVSLAFSLRRLGEATRQALPDLAVFQGLCMEDDMLAITEMDAALWRVARRELEQAALLRVESLPGVKPPFLHFHPTLLPYLSTQLSAERRAALEEKYWRRYYALANYLYQADTQTPHQARAIAVREMPNLRRGVDLALAAGEVAAAVEFADSIAEFLDVFGRWRERDALLARVAAPLAGGEAGERSAAITKAEFLLQSRQGETLLQQGQAQQAEALFRALLARLAAGAAYDNQVELDYDMAMTQARLGRCLAAQGRPQQAIAWHRKAIAGFERLGQTNQSAKEMLGVVFADLGDCLAGFGQFDEAQRAYESSVTISRDSDNQRQIGVALGQLGTLALQRGDLAAAQERYLAALDTFRALEEPRMEAVAWHQLGIVAEEARQWAEAERCYRESLQIKERHQDWPGVAQTCNQLAMVAEGDGRPADAERWYLREIEIDEQIGNPKELAIDYSNLASLYLAQARLAEAEDYARRALAIKETLDLSAEPWNTYQVLAKIAAAQGDSAAAARWRRQEQESYAAYAGVAHQLPSWAPDFIRAVVAAAQGNQEAQAAVAQILPQLEERGWTDMTASIKQILAGVLDENALYANLDHQDAYIIRAILQQLAGV